MHVAGFFPTSSLAGFFVYLELNFLSYQEDFIPKNQGTETLDTYFL
jgi:hypothetical protein